MTVEGRWAEARQLCVKARTVPDDSFAYTLATRALGPLARNQGDANFAWSLVREQMPDGLASQPGDVRFFDAQIAQRLAAALAIDEGDVATARGWLEAHDRWLEWSGAVHGRADAHLGWAHYYRADGDAELAYQHATKALRQASDPRQPLALLAAQRLLGELDTETGRYDDAAPISVSRSPSPMPAPLSTNGH